MEVKYKTILSHSMASRGFSDAELMAVALKILLIYSVEISEDVVTDVRSHE